LTKLDKPPQRLHNTCQGEVLGALTWYHTRCLRDCLDALFGRGSNCSVLHFLPTFPFPSYTSDHLTTALRCKWSGYIATVLYNMNMIYTRSRRPPWYTPTQRSEDNPPPYRKEKNAMQMLYPMPENAMQNEYYSIPRAPVRKTKIAHLKRRNILTHAAWRHPSRPSLAPVGMSAEATQL
jgi:hypothetical protein